MPRFPLLLGCLLLVGCGDSASTTPAPPPASATGAVAPDAAPRTGPGSTDVAGLKAALDAGDAVVIDVRNPDEFAAGHVPGARLVPLGELSGRLAELDDLKSRPVHVICASGGRSARATSVLAQAGFANPINVTGGTRAWIAAGHPVE